MSLHESVFRSQPEEHAFSVSRVQGTVPADLSGTFLRSGPGRMDLGDDTLNFFDGHALIAGLSFEAGRATFRSRFVRSPLLDEEARAGALRKRRAFTNLPSRWKNLLALDFGNSAMHDVHAWGDGAALRVIAGNDPGHFGLDPHTLATLGPETWGGAVKPGEDMAPMPYRDPHSGRLIAWIKQPGGLRPDKVRFVELDGRFQVVHETPSHALGAAPVLLHDQRATATWYVAVEQSLRLSPARAAWGASTLWDSLSTPPGSTPTLLLVPRTSGGPMLRVPLPSPVEIAFHVVNAYDDGGKVIVDLVIYEGRIPFEAAASARHLQRTGVGPVSGPLPTPVRYVVDPTEGRIVSTRRLGSLPGEAPEVADDRMGRPYRYAWFPTPVGPSPDRSFYVYDDGIAKLDVESGEAEVWATGGPLVSPAAFVSRGSALEDDGWVLSWLITEEGAAVVILDGLRPGAGPVATLHLGIHLPGVSHTRWAPTVHLGS